VQNEIQEKDFTLQDLRNKIEPKTKQFETQLERMKLEQDKVIKAYNQSDSNELKQLSKQNIDLQNKIQFTTRLLEE